MRDKNSEQGSFFSGRRQYLAIGVLFVILVIVLVVFSIFRGGSSSKEDTAAKATGDEIGTEPLEVPEDAKLEKNAHEDVNEFFNRYYKAMAAGDVDTMIEMGNVMDEDDKTRTKAKANFYEDYRNMSCFTKPGPEKNSYVVFVYYEIKVKNIDTLAPGLTTYYLCTAADGSLYLKDLSLLPQNMRDYIGAITNQEDVQNLLTTVQELYDTNTKADPTLAAFMSNVKERIEMAAAEERANTGEGGEAAATTAVSEVQVKTTKAVNIRSGPSQDTEKIASAAAGDTFVRISEEGEWSKIRYNDGEAYIKSEFLSTAEGDTVVSGEVQSQNGEESAESAPAESSSSSSSGGSVTVKEAASIRGSASTDGEKLGSAYKGAIFKLLGEENGWYKIDYNGKTGYIRNDLATKS
ncbi:MAG: SH3 domain-containing protein [Lachnospiraceae bacterium]|nr:SH3 domain-containing protein [Lachnospiraceae bacterium]